MNDVMLMLGLFQFSVSTAAYQQLARSNGYRWAAQERVGQYDALQYTGAKNDTITLTGVVFAEYKSGTEQLTAMRAQAALGLPQLMVDGRGFIHGRWVIEEVEETATVFARAGVARRQQFTLKLRKYDNGPAVSFA